MVISVSSTWLLVSGNLESATVFSPVGPDCFSMGSIGICLGCLLWEGCTFVSNVCGKCDELGEPKGLRGCGVGEADDSRS
jgi:hypothetical protein